MVFVQTWERTAYDRRCYAPNAELTGEFTGEVGGEFRAQKNRLDGRFVCANRMDVRFAVR